MRTRILIPAVFLLLLAGYLHPVTALTQDLGRHILTGRLILQTGSVPKANLYSYTYPDFPFINHHWLSEVLFAVQEQIVGFIGLQLISITVVCLAFGLVFFYASRNTSPPALVAISIIYLSILFERTDIRPEIYSYLYLSLFVVILYAYRERFTRLIYFLIPLSVLWVNSHIYFFVGIVVTGLFLADEIFIHRHNLRQRRVVALACTFVGVALATILNPNSLDGALYPLQVFQNYGYTIEENQTVFLLQQLGFSKPSFPYLFLGVFTLFTALAIAYKKSRPIDWLLAVVFTLAAFLAVRNFPLFVFATLIPASIALTEALRKLQLAQSTRHAFSKGVPFLLLLIILWQIYSLTTDRPLGLGVARGAERGADFYLQQNIKGPLFNNFDIGSYITYRMFPRERVFIDGRPEAYPDEFITNTYIPMQENPSHFATASEAYKFNAIFFSHTDQTPWGVSFLQTILRSSGWTPVYLDDTVLILVKNTPQNERLIRSHGMTTETLYPKILDEKDYQGLLRLASFFNKTQLTAQELAIYQKILVLKPDNCQVLYNAAILLEAQKDPTAGVFAARYTASCS